MPSIKDTPLGMALRGFASGMGIDKMEKKLAEDQAVLKDTLKQHNDYYKNWNTHSRKTEETDKKTDNTQTSVLSTLKGSWKTATSQSHVFENIQKLLGQIASQLVLMIPAGAAGATGVGGSGGSGWKPILDAIASGESVGGSYDSAFGGKTIPGLSNMTISQADALQPGWAQKYGSSAMGRYQFMNIKSQAAAAGIGANEKFSPANQDKMAVWLAMNKRGVTLEMVKKDPKLAQHLLSMEWAGVPDPMKGGKSYYAGVGSNKATISQATMDRAFASAGNSGIGGGGLSGAKALADSLGLTMTSFNTGTHSDNSLHYQNRAMDFGGDPAKMSQLASALSRTNPTELIWAGAGPQSIKFGQRKPPDFWGAKTWGNHRDHVHVAYALGAGMPAFFNSQRAAVNWERSMMPAGASVRSVTSNTSEGLSGAMVTAPITINAGSGQNAKEIAAEVIFELNRAVTEVRAASLYG